MYTKNDFKVGQRVRVTLEGTIKANDYMGVKIALPNSEDNLFLRERLADVVNVEVMKTDPATLPEGTIIHFDLDPSTLTYRIVRGTVRNTAASSCLLSLPVRMSNTYTVIYNPTEG